MGDLIERLRKYLPLSSYPPAAEETGDLSSHAGVDPGGIVMWNLIVNDILKAVRSESRTISLKDIDFKASRQILLDEMDQLIFWCTTNNPTPTQVSEKLSATVVSIASRHFRQYKVGPELVGTAKQHVNKDAEQENSSAEVTKRILMHCLPQFINASHCEMGNDGMFIEALLTPLAAALVANEVNGPEKILAFKIWRFAILNSDSAVRNHGVYFVPFMVKYGDWLLSLPCRDRAAFVAITAEQMAVYTEILRQILLCVQAMAIREDPSDSIMHAMKTKVRGEDHDS